MIDNYKISRLNEEQFISESAVRSDRGIYDHVYEKYWKMVIDVIKRVILKTKKIGISDKQLNLMVI